MDRIIAPVNHDDQNAIVNLQDGLRRLLTGGVIAVEDPRELKAMLLRLANESRERVYGSETTGVVGLFQRQNRIRPTGEVDETTTADALNNELQRIGGFDDEGNSGWSEVVRALQQQTETLQAINEGTRFLPSIEGRLGGLADAGTLQGVKQGTDQLSLIKDKLGDLADAGTLQGVKQGTDRLAQIDANIGRLAERSTVPPLSFSARGDAVRAMQATLTSVGFTLPQREITEAILGVGTRAALLQLQAQCNLARTGVFDDATRNALKIASEGAAYPNRIEGRIFLENGLPAGRVMLQIVHKGFGTATTPLGQLGTDERGFYALPYTVDGAVANLEISVRDTAGQWVKLALPKFNAGRHEVLNLVAPTSVRTQTSEHQLLTEDLTQYSGGNLDQLPLTVESDDWRKRQDVSQLHQNTGWDARLITVAVIASRLTGDTGLSQAVLYSAFRAGLPTDIQALSLVSPEAFETALTRAKDAGIEALTADDIAAAKTKFARFALEARRQAVAPGTRASVGTLLDAGLDPTYKTTFEDLLLLHEFSGVELWRQARDKGIPGAQIERLQLQGKLAYLTLNNAPLMQTLQNEVGSSEHLAQMVDEDLYRKDAWTTRLTTLAGNNDTVLAQLIPPAYAHERLSDRLDAYVADLALKVRQSFPSQVVTRMLEKDELTLGAQHDLLKAPVHTFLKNASAQGFQLGRTSISQLMAQHGVAVLEGIAPEDVEKAQDGAKILQRAYQMTPTDEAMATLLALGFTSASQVTAIPHDAFVDRYWQDFGSREVTELVYTKSAQITSVTYNMYTLARQIESTAPVVAIAGTPERRTREKDTLTAALKEYPTMQSLFGSLDFCECEHCRSVLSPAAYLVDLLQFLDPRDAVWQRFLTDWAHKHQGQAYDGPASNYRKPYDELHARRPDLSSIELTCENTNTAMPYIDLVNEILEFYVAHNNQLTADAAHNTDAATSAELLAEPQHLIPDAYNILRAARYPLTLPFDLWLEWVRRFFDHFETPRWQVLETFRPGDDLFAPGLPYDRARIFAEYLGIIPAEYTIYTAASLDGWPTLYGFDAPNAEQNARDALKSAKTLADRLGVTYKELVELVQTGFVNPRLSALVTLHKLGIAVSDVCRLKKHPGYPPLTADEEAAFKDTLAQCAAKFQPAFDAARWLDDTWAAGTFNQVLLLKDPDAGCSFDETLVVRADGTAAEPLTLVKLNLFVRLWRRLGWPMDDLDRALQTFAPAHVPITDTTLGAVMRTVLVYLAHLKALDSQVNVGKNSRQKLLTLWADLPTNGANPLYAQLFLTRTLLRDNPAFDDPLGNYLTKPHIFLSTPGEKDHLPALQAALNLTADEIRKVLNTVGKDVATAALSLANVSLLYRYALLAKALKVSVADLITLRAISGLDPFALLSQDALETLADDAPFTKTLEFMRVVQGVKASRFTVADLDYLYRHRFDPVGTYRDATDTTLAWFQSLVAELRRIAADYAVPDDADSLSDDLLRQKMALVFAPDVGETLLGFWKDTREFAASKEPVVPAKRLHPARYEGNDIRVAYDATRERQQLIHRGVLTAAKKATILSAIPAPASTEPQDAQDAYQNFVELLEKIAADSQPRCENFFDTYFDGLLTFNDVFGPGAAGLSPAEKRHNLLQKILPFLEQKAVRQAVVQRLVAQTGGDSAMVETLMTDQAVLALPDQPAQPLLTHVAALATRGLSAEFFASGALSDPPASSAIVTAVDIAAPAGIQSARWRGAIEVAQTGPYRFYARLGKQNAAVTLRFEHLPEPVLTHTAAGDDEESSAFVELQAGVLYRVTVEARNLQDGGFGLLVKGETTAKGSLAQLGLLPHSALDAALRAYTLLSKALHLAQGLGLNRRELRYLLTHGEDFDHLDWRKLPTGPVADEAAATLQAQALFTSFVRLLGYATLKGELAGGGDDLIGIFEAARRTTPESVSELCQRMKALARRDLATVQDTAAQLKLTAPEHFADERRLQRLWEALKIVAAFGVPVPSLARWLTAAPDAAIAQDVRNTIKARYESETWQRLATSIFKPLRQRQRDALVARIMHTTGFESVERLFEYFLIDPGMEPVVQTSRIRLAISSLQTFIQRCFLNLEPRVPPSALNEQHWAWMKRYRVWEANRKIFLFPENWLEPEWRDDKTHLFQELESSLLQGDVTDELAADAFSTYLNRLNQLARLEIVTMYAEEKATDTPTLHVIGRTYTTPHQYFYRRYAHQMWTPWEPVSAEIEGEHVVAMVWRERLHLFWLTFMEKVEPTGEMPNNNSTTAFQDLTFDALKDATRQVTSAATRRNVDIQLSWSEYFQGEWTPRESSGFGNMVELTGPFDGSKVFVYVSKETDAETGADGAALIYLGGLAGIHSLLGIPVSYHFRVVSTNSRPTIAIVTALDKPQQPYVTGDTAYNRFTSPANGKLTVEFTEENKTIHDSAPTLTPATQDILAQGGGYTLLVCSNPMRLPSREIAQMISPVFYQDDRYTFFVEPSLTETTVDRWEGYVITRPSHKSTWHEYIATPPPLKPSIPPHYWAEQPKLGPGKPPKPEPIDQLAIHAIHDGTDWLTQPGMHVLLDGTVIGPTGGRQLASKFAGGADSLAGADVLGRTERHGLILGNG